MSTTRSLYTYEPLKSRSIRLLKILPDLYGNPIGLTLKAVHLDVTDPYDAVSYTWGSDAWKHDVWVDGRVLRIRENIWLFLKHCRDNIANHDTWLWIDSICIDQANVAEKNQQVPLMSHIFGNAQHVLVWLGETAASCTIADRAAKWAAEHKEMDWNEFLDQELSPALSARAHIVQGDIAQILRNEYWQRTWIIQEVMLAQQAYIISGTSAIEMNALRAMYGGQRYLRGHNAPCDSLWDHCRRVIVHYNASTPAKRSLDVLVQIFGSQNCTNPKDRIYGLLGIVEHGEDFPVNYSAPNEQVILQAMHHIQRYSEHNMKEERRMHITLPAVNDLMDALVLDDEDVINYIRTSTNELADPFQEMTFFLRMTLIACYSRCSSTCDGHFRTYKDEEYLNFQCLERKALNSTALGHGSLPQDALYEFSFNGTKPTIWLDVRSTERISIHSIVHAQSFGEVDDGSIFGWHDIRPGEEPEIGVIQIFNAPYALSSSWEANLNHKGLAWNAIQVHGIQEISIPCSAEDLIELASFCKRASRLSLPYHVKQRLGDELLEQLDPGVKCLNSSENLMADSLDYSFASMPCTPVGIYRLGA